ncbi:globin-coupled sensor protein [Bacillus sp. CGMCC 1.16541]|uniref:globin-coupled sensor protein n=1 Tax=Bacillus sp. CGMCC 1.16541 TaxID=2185143 RepID=UPI000D7390F5|nr:globin-coupled sensor protein [Bacillus sp. CGMCC 1.16541]
MALLWRTKVEQTSWVDEAQRMNVWIQVSEGDVIDKIQMVHLTEKDLQLIKYLQPFIKEHLSVLVDSFYQTVLQIPQLEQMITTYTNVDHLKHMLGEHLVDLFSGQLDHNFYEKRLQVAKAHYRIGLKPAWYMGAFQNIQHSLFDMVFRFISIKEEGNVFIQAVSKLLSLEQQIVLEAYETEYRYHQEREYESIRQEVKGRILDISTELVALSQQTRASVDTLIHNSHKVSEVVSESNEESLMAQSFIEEGQEYMNELIANIQTIDLNTKNMNEAVEKLSKASSQITSVIKIVQDIADQTNLLALNSAIEAARAGEHGRGFAVVSEEVRKLAEQTKKSVGEIQELVNNSNQYTEYVLKALNSVNDTVVMGDHTSKRTSEAFSNISVSIHTSAEKGLKVKEQMNHLVETIKEIGESTSGVAKSAEHLNETANMS